MTRRSRFYTQPPYEARKTYTFTGEGEETITIFTITGSVVVVALVPRCKTLLGVTNTPSIQLGVTGSTDLLIPVTLASEIDADEWWLDATPTAKGKALPAELKDIAIDQNIVAELTDAGGTIDSGAIEFTVWYVSASADGELKEA